MPLHFGFLSEARAVFVWTAKSIYFIFIFFCEEQFLMEYDCLRTRD